MQRPDDFDETDAGLAVPLPLKASAYRLAPVLGRVAESAVLPELPLDAFERAIDRILADLEDVPIAPIADFPAAIEDLGVADAELEAPSINETEALVLPDERLQSSLDIQPPDPVLPEAVATPEALRADPIFAPERVVPTLRVEPILPLPPRMAPSAVPLTREIEMPRPAPVFIDEFATESKAASPILARQDRFQRGLKPQRSVLSTIARFMMWAGVTYASILVLLLAVYRFVDPPMSSLMVQQRLLGQPITQQWVSLDDVSPEVVRAVMLSEDGRFCTHAGVDLEEMQNAIEKAGDGLPRGASTISMQVIKNLLLWPSKSYLRKAIEIPLTYLMEVLWPKRRIMEIYLNIAEWGPGIFGVEAASQHHFNKSARQLNEREASLLAVALPNPIARDAGDPGRKTRRLATDIQARMRNASPSQTACAMPVRRSQPSRSRDDASGWDLDIRPDFDAETRR